MRTTLSIMVAALALAPAAATAQQPAVITQATPTVLSPAFDFGSSNFIDFGARGSAFGDNSDKARYQRYRDLGNGATVDVLRYKSENEHRLWNVQADHVGYRDQRYSASYNQYGKLKASFEWNQIPLFFSQDTATLYSSSVPGVLLLDDSIQTGLQNKTITLAGAVAGATPFDMRLKRSVAEFKATYSATRQLDLNLVFRNTTKVGSQPWAGDFGQSNSVELAVPLDTRTTELGASAEWANDQGSVRVGYDGSFFRNNVSTLTWDNPQRVTDSATLGPAQGRLALWPNSNMNAGNISGTFKLPAHSQATGYVSLGRWSQNDPLIPFTINSALPVIPLDRPTADARANVTSTAFSFNSRPTRMLWLNARFRSYDFDNRTPVFNMTQTVAYDTTVSAFGPGSSPYSYKRKTFDADASLTPVSYASFRVGYTREANSQTYRAFDTTTENTVRVSADTTSLHWLTLRAVYEHGKRVGTGFDEQALDDVGEQVSLRQFDISDRNSNRFSGIVMLIPWSTLSFNGTVSAGNEDRPAGVFGLRSNDNRAYSFGMDYVPKDAVSMGFSYEHEKFTSLQRSRQANPGVQFDDPTRDWTTDANDKADTFTASIDLLKVVPRTDVRVGYNLSRADSTYVYGLTPDTTLGPLVQLPSVTNQLQRGTVDVRHRVNAHIAAGLLYWYDRYRVSDFALGPQTLTSRVQGTFTLLGYLYRPYTANTISARLTYLF